MRPKVPRERPLCFEANAWHASSKRSSLWARQNARTPRMSPERPLSETCMSTFVPRGTLSVRTSMHSVAGSTSAKTGSAPRKRTAFADATIVRFGTMTLSPRPTRSASSARISADVPLVVATTYFAPTNRAISRSNAEVSVNSVIHPPLLRYESTILRSLPVCHGSIWGMAFIEGSIAIVSSDGNGESSRLRLQCGG